MAVRTLFNILGPLTNPAGAPNILMGVFHPDLVGIQARVLKKLGSKRALVVWGRDGVDEISLGERTLVGELRNGEISEYEIAPEDFGLARAPLSALRVDDPQASKAMLLEAIEGRGGPAADVVALNAGAALYAAGIAVSIQDGLARARAEMAKGTPRAKLDRFVALTNAKAGAGA
jgi:anthranilate phosphoribosyltransferase